MSSTVMLEASVLSSALDGPSRDASVGQQLLSSLRLRQQQFIVLPIFDEISIAVIEQVPAGAPGQGVFVPVVDVGNQCVDGRDSEGIRR